MNFNSLMDLKSAAAHLHVKEGDLRSAAVAGDIESVSRGDKLFFEHRALDEWAQRHVLGESPRDLSREHQADMLDRQKSGESFFRISSILKPETIAPSLSARNKAGILRDMTDFADSTGLLYDPATLFVQLSAREEIASTAAGGGVAFLHPRYHDPYLFQETFLALGRAERPVFFGSQDGNPTDLFFLICCTDHVLHLHILTRLCLIAHNSSLLDDLRAAPSPEDMHAAIKKAEDEFLEPFSRSAR